MSEPMDKAKVTVEFEALEVMQVMISKAVQLGLVPDGTYSGLEMDMDGITGVISVSYTKFEPRTKAGQP